MVETYKSNIVFILNVYTMHLVQFIILTNNSTTYTLIFYISQALLHVSMHSSYLHVLNGFYTTVRLVFLTIKKFNFLMKSIFSCLYLCLLASYIVSVDFDVNVLRH